MKLKVTAYKPSGKYYGEQTVEIPKLHSWKDSFIEELTSAMDRVNHRFTYLVENHPRQVERSRQAGEELPFHNALYHPGDLKTEG